MTYAVLGHVGGLVIVHADHGPLVVVEERAGRAGGALGVQVDDVHERGDDEGVAQRRRHAVAHRERVRRRGPVPVGVLVPETPKLSLSLSV